MDHDHRGYCPACLVEPGIFIRKEKFKTNQLMHYQLLGTGKPIFLVHGFGEDSRIWERQLAISRTGCQLIIPDLPGTGKSAPQPGLTMESMAAGILEILDKENIERCTLLGHSMGGYISLAFAELFPDRINGLGLLHSSAFADSEAKKETRRKSIGFIEKQGSLPFLETSTPNLFAEENRLSMTGVINQLIERHAYMEPATLTAFTAAMMVRPDRTEILKKAGFPVLFIIGKEDQAVPFTDSLQQVYLPDLSYIYILDKSGHMGMLEETENFNQAVEDFISRLPV
jgi:pimeloyl-ACP methyl ester carboxylesterase